MEANMVKKTFIALFVVSVFGVFGFYALKYVKQGEKMEMYSSKYDIDTEENLASGKYIKNVFHKTIINSDELYRASLNYEMDWQANIIYDWGLKNPDGSFPLSPSPIASKMYTKRDSPIKVFSGGVDGGSYVELDLHTPQKYNHIINIKYYEVRSGGYVGKAAYYCFHKKMFASKLVLMDFTKDSFYIHGDTMEKIDQSDNMHCVYIPLEPSKIIYRAYKKLEDNLWEITFYHKAFQNIDIPKELSDYGKVFIINNSSLIATRIGVHPSVGKGLWITYDGEHEMFFQSIEPSLYDVDDYVPVWGDYLGPFTDANGRLLHRVF